MANEVHTSGSAAALAECFRLPSHGGADGSENEHKNTLCKSSSEHIPEECIPISILMHVHIK